MSRGNEIIVSANPRGVFMEGTVYGTPKPGTMMQIRNASLSRGRFTFEAYAPGADGNRSEICILLADDQQGKLATDAYVDGTPCKVYYPLPGEEINILFGDTSGTADDLVIGQKLICDSGTGKFIPTTGSPQSEPFKALEALTDPTADQLIWAMCTGM